MSNNSCQYTRLEPGSRQIRLVHILPGSWDDPIACELHVVSLDAHPTYQALSYVWGDPNVTNAIFLDHCTFHVTINLYSALRRLRKASGVSTMWIDAICINQSDANDRTEQVTLMGSIYENCQDVFMWLGDRNQPHLDGDKRMIEEAITQPWHRPEADNISLEVLGSIDFVNDDVLAAFTIIYMLTRQRHLRELPCFVKAGPSGWDISDRFAHGFKGLQSLIRLPYWNRIWVVQEIILSPVATVVFGSITAPWKMFADAAESFMQHINTCCKLDVPNLPYEESWTLGDFYHAVLQIEDIRGQRLVQKPVDLIGLLCRYLPREATDARDKAYALIGLVNTWYGGSPLLPDYTIPTREAYEKLTMHIIYSKQNLHVLVGDSVCHPDYPSWVADWSRPADHIIWSWESARAGLIPYYRACNGGSMVAEHLQESMLRVEGTIADTIIAVGELMRWEDWDEPLITCEQLLGMGGLRGDSQQEYRSGGSWKDAYWRTICADIVGPAYTRERSQLRRTRSEDKRLYEMWDGRLRSVGAGGQGSSEDLEAVEGYKRSICTATINRRFLVTRNGYLGLGPKGVRAGDDVYILIGSRVPFVLRKVDTTQKYDRTEEDSGIPPYSTFHLVGDCYIHGAMDGEVCSNNGNTQSLVLC